MVLPHIVGVLFNLFVVHGGDGVTTLADYSADLVRAFPDRIYLFLGLDLRVGTGGPCPFCCSWKIAVVNRLRCE